MYYRDLLIFVISMSLALGVVLTGSCRNSEHATALIEDVTPSEAFTLIQENQNNPDFIIVDIRTPAEFADGHIEGAVNIDYYGETFTEELGSLDINKTCLVYCRTGNRSGNTLPVMEELGFTKIYHLSDGIVAWNSAGLPVVK